MGLKKQVLLLWSVLILDVMLLIGCLSILQENAGREVMVSTREEGGGQKMAALTFDDGPNKKYTGRLLEGLRERGVKVTFFLMGECLEGNEDLVRIMAKEGHLIGVHCMQHTQLTKIAVKDAVRNLQETKEHLETILRDGKNGQQTIEYIRPPYGSWNGQLDEAVRTDLSMEPVFWDVDSQDWKFQNTEKIVRNVIDHVENGDIILMHDEFETSVEASFQIIDNLMAKGYTFVTVNELMVD